MSASLRESVLDVRDLKVTIGRRTIVEDISFSVQKGQTVGLVGESGSGKSMTVLAATGLMDAPASKATGSSVLAGGTELIGATQAQLRKVHGSRIGFVFQDPSTSLNPLLTIQRQITESLEAHGRGTPKEARRRALELLEAVGLPDPEDRLHSFPHQLSGGQRQRVMIAIALACEPELLIADEPTTALDVTTERQIIELVWDLQERLGSAVIWISHDLGVIGQVADDVTVLRHGNIVEQAPVQDIFAGPREAYTRELLDARPLIGVAAPPTPPGESPVLLDVQDLDVKFQVRTPTGSRTIHAVDDVSFQVRKGHTLGIVGESGSGKSTIANALTGLVEPEAGTATLTGTDLFQLSRGERRDVRRRLAMVFQDPFSSLNPRTKIGASIAEPLKVHRLGGKDKGARKGRVQELLDLVHLPRDFASRFPHELSGGQRQRVSIARALALEPDVIILDEATSALDVSVQAKVLDLLRELQGELGLTYLFIAHDLAVVQQMSHDVLVMQKGRAVEHREATELFADPREDYTKMLLAAIPPAEPRAGARV
ncbi:ABC transporter ATP-binding protein [Brachybacterium sp. p3-SID1565]|uniref:ABC transporter ATP-binding protein n=1 Tax=Brachybacterium sp. p3-SID1565 TaxID=2916046 RepID=UPI0021A26263|nr:ABC transporter ATP-binding protein [Brachybacterium sp. p3-SID1565]MCT1384504.1 ABC transporter ATP-binding protein [Brachybacterium sp. p3-SID1565]